MNLGETLKLLRVSMRLTQENVAKSINVSIQTIYKYEHSIITNISIDKIEAMAVLFEVDPASILGWTRSEEHPSTNGDLSALHELLRRNPGMRILFDASKNATEQDLLDAAALIENFKRRRNGDD